MQDQEAAEEASGRLGSPLSGGSLCLGRRVHFQLPHTTISLPSAQQEEQAFYQRLECLLAGAAGASGSFEELFAADGWEDLTGEMVGGGRRWALQWSSERPAAQSARPSWLQLCGLPCAS